MQSNTNTGVVSSLSTIDNSTVTGFDAWDVTQGFMGSGTVKQASGSGARSYSKNIFSTLTIIATQLFGQNSPILYVIGIFATLTLVFITYLVIKFVRTGN